MQQSSSKKHTLDRTSSPAVEKGDWLRARAAFDPPESRPARSLSPFSIGQALIGARFLMGGAAGVRGPLKEGAGGRT